MIQSMSAPQTPGHLAPRAAQPIGATAAAAAPVLDAQAAAAGQPGFGAQMARAADAEQLPAVELPALPFGALQAAPTDDAASGLPVREAAPATEENPPELTAEQWLLGMLGQQQTQVQARDAGQPAAPVAPAAIALVATAAPTRHGRTAAGINRNAAAGRATGTERDGRCAGPRRNASAAVARGRRADARDVRCAARGRWRRGGATGS